MVFISMGDEPLMKGDRFEFDSVAIVLPLHPTS